MAKSRNARARNAQRQQQQRSKPKASANVSSSPSAKSSANPANGEVSGNANPTESANRSPDAKSSTSAGALEQQIADAVRELPEEQQTRPVEGAPEALSAAELRTAWEDLQRLRTAIEQRETQTAEAQEQAQRHELEIEQREQALVERSSELDVLRQELADVELTLGASEGALAERGAGLDEREEQIVKRRGSLDARGEQLDAREEALARDRQTLTHEQRQLQIARQSLESDRALFDEHVDQRTAARHEWFSAEVKSHEERLAQARADRDRLEARLRKAEDGARAIGGRSAEEVLAELDALRSERRALQDELIARPPAEQAGRVEELTRHNDALRDELASARRLQGDLEIELDQLRTQAAAQQLAQDHAEALKSTIAGYRAALEEEKQHFKDLVALQEATPPFERMTAMDANPVLSEKPALMTQPESLAGFVESLRARIATRSPESGAPLYYSTHDLRVFIAGLASSPLQILQGLSGTGKTSLPIAIAEAIDCGAAVVEVQAGWRDRQDLIGHYNTFERRYDETPFVQALYEAQCPAYRDRPYFIVLDEMNLSYAEQYFTSLLSAITRKQPEITLTNSALPEAPRLLRAGRILRIPPNVWFVGTANHDETTKEFADKTYDRAHVQELSRHPEPFSPTTPEHWEPVSFTALKGLFDSARDEHEQAALAARAYLKEELEDIFAERFRAPWGNRLDPQIDDFVPVLISAGGDLGEAVDHVLATKILRKIRDRHDIQLKDIDDLEERILESWPRLGDVSEPTASLEIVEREKQRLSGGIG